MQVTRKVNVSLPNGDVYKSTGELIEQGLIPNLSVAAELGLELVASMNVIDRQVRIARMLSRRRATTPNAWIDLFWDGLAHAFNQEDFDRDGKLRTAQRQYMNFDVRYLVFPNDDDGHVHL